MRSVLLPLNDNEAQTGNKREAPGELSRGVVIARRRLTTHSQSKKGTSAEVHARNLEPRPYSPGLSPCDFHIFSELKKHRGTMKHTDEFSVLFISGKLGLYALPINFR
ncbi:hypothetical protein AVEN_260843-1 [Araneus ventricosus]|uniref:Uncharacterized protein n=1 Tax=Araneus ventricosus TaxID=182803 RepID=A0A4Y2M3X9_ARAVE|nr:hypothetical protein AVEN_260843-1 [Araneus ventricosus]